MLHDLHDDARQQAEREQHFVPVIPHELEPLGEDHHDGDQGDGAGHMATMGLASTARFRSVMATLAVSKAAASPAKATVINLILPGFFCAT